MSAGSLPADPAHIAHHGQEGFCLEGGVPDGSSIATGPCDVQIIICHSAAALAKWDCDSERAKGCAATVKATASSRHVRNPAHSLRIDHGLCFSSRKAMAVTSQSAKLECLFAFRQTLVCQHWTFVTSLGPPGDKRETPQKSSIRAAKNRSLCSQPL